MLNIVALMGRLVAEPELRHTPSGIATCTFRIAADRNYSKDGERKADFIDIVTWRQTAEFVCKYFHKGSMIAVNGSIQTRNYEDKNGNKRTAFEVVAEGVHFASTAREAPKVDAQRTPEPFKTNAAAADVQQDNFAVIDDSEDLPF
jgi:single-strand DNA-binding protein